MTTKIRLKRMGAKGQPSYRLIVTDSRNARDGKAIEVVGFYNPLTDPATVVIHEEKVFRWLGNGCQLSDTARDILRRKGVIQRWKKGESPAKKTDEKPERLPVI